MGVLGFVLEALLYGAAFVASCSDDVKGRLDNSETLQNIKKEQSSKYVDMANKVLRNPSAYTPEQVEKAREVKEAYQEKMQSANEQLQSIRMNKAEQEYKERLNEYYAEEYDEDDE